MIFLVIHNCYAQTTTLVAVGANNKLVYTPDAKGNVIPDFSGVGYKNSEAPIPFIPVVLTVNAVVGNNRMNVQNAINTVAAMPLQANGFRGAILFNAGTYLMDSAVYIKTSGIVLRGVGATTIFKATGTYQYDLVNIIGAQGKTDVSSSQKQIQDIYVPYGAKQVSVVGGHTFQIGDWVNVRREPNAKWITALGMDTLTNIDPAVTNWTAASYQISYERQITNVVGNMLTFDAPVMDVIDSNYAKGFVVKFTSNRIENCGVENMDMTSVYANSTDEKHAWDAIFIDNIRNAWVKKVNATVFGYTCVNISDGATYVTVDSCTMYDAISIITDSRRYSFNIDGQRCLVQNCKTRRGRHDYVNGSRTPGPNVFYNCSSTLEYNDMGPHHRWSTGILFDNIVGSNSSQLNVQNRLDLGSGHGWSGGQIMFWNCTVPSIVCQDVPTDETNWAIGCIGTVKNVGAVCTAPFGVVQSTGTKIVAIPSLFKAQLNDRIIALPVKFISFNALENSNRIELKWSTASEINSKYFAVEKSKNGKDFTQIGTVYSASLFNYSFIDEKPFAGNNYYRLKQVDNDGSWAYSNTVNVFSQKKKEVGLSISPNPTSGEVALKLPTNNPNLICRLLDIKGNVLLNRTGSLIQFQQDINRKMMVAKVGYYAVEIRDNGKTFFEKFIKY